MAHVVQIAARVDEAQRLAYVEQTLATLIQRVHALEEARAAPKLPRPPARGAGALEAQLGTYWLSRLGIVSLITGAALLVITYFGELGTLLRVTLGYAMAGAVAWIGLWIARRHATFGRVVFAGGLAIAYFVTYALHFVPSMRIVDSEVVGVALVALAIAGVVAIAHRMQSETVAGVALFLGLHTGLLSDVTELSLVCTTLLALGAGFFIAKNRWVIVPFSTVIAVYTTHAALAADADATVLVSFIAVDFALFAVAMLLRPDLRERAQIALAAANWLGALALGSRVLAGVSHDAWFAYACVLAGVHAGLAAIAHVRRAPTAHLLAIAIATAAVALPIRVHGYGLLAGWLALALVAAAIARKRGAFAYVAVSMLALAQGDAYLTLGVWAAVACAIAWLAAERLSTRTRDLLIGGVTLALAHVVAVGFASELHAVAGVGAALVLFALGFALRTPSYRWAGFAMLALAAGRVITAHLDADQRIATFVIAGVVLLAVSFVYTRRAQ